jgi:hypothetical protein
MIQRFCSTALVLSLLFCSVGCSGRGAARRASRSPIAFAKWQEFKAPDGTFSVFFPKVPKPSSKQGRTADLTWYTSTNKTEFYYVSCSSTKDEAVADQRDRDKNVEVRRANLFSKNQKAITFCGEPALEMTWTEGVSRYRGVVLKTHQGHHLYTLWARYRGNEPANVQQFFSSFKPGSYTPKPVPSATPNLKATASPTPEDEEEAGAKANDEDEAEGNED